MCIFFGGPAMRGPARVADTVGAVEWLLPQNFFEVAQLSFGAPNLELMAFVNNSYACRVIAAVLELAQTVDYQRHDLFVSDVSDYSTHSSER
jgi:hypothetical protein